ncbi:MAG: hypothetical protein NVS3B1_28420 [Marmoricola sp.]
MAWAVWVASPRGREEIVLGEQLLDREAQIWEVPNEIRHGVGNDYVAVLGVRSVVIDKAA